MNASTLNRTVLIGRSNCPVITRRSHYQVVRCSSLGLEYLIGVLAYQSQSSALRNGSSLTHNVVIFSGKKMLESWGVGFAFNCRLWEFANWGCLVASLSAGRMLEFPNTHLPLQSAFVSSVYAPLSVLACVSTSARYLNTCCIVCRSLASGYFVMNSGWGRDVRECILGCLVSQAHSKTGMTLWTCFIAIEALIEDKRQMDAL